MKRCLSVMPLFIGLALSCSVVWASKAYVTDAFRISLRRGPSIENKILKFLPSGLPVEVLESNEGWSRIQPMESDEEGLTGWVLSRYLMTRLPWEDQAKQLTEEVTQLRDRLESSEKTLTETKLREETLARQLRENKDLYQKLQNDYVSLKQSSGEVLKLKAMQENAEDGIKRLTSENERLKNSQMNRWFALGALVLLCGLMIGLLIGRQQKKQPSSRYY